MQRIIPGELLPDHTKLRYNECYAKLILENVFPERYSGLQFSDKPDLRNQSNTIGIEVTSSIPKNTQETKKLWLQLENKTAKNPKRNKERMLKLGVRYTGGTQCWPSTVYPTGHFESSPYTKILDVFKGKVYKLNNGDYSMLERYDLFIETELFAERIFMPVILKKAISLNTKELKYSFLYVLFLNRVCVFDLEKNTYEIRLFIDRYKTAIDARRMVEDGEND